MLCEGIFQFSKKGINIQIANETVGKQRIFQNQEALANLNLKTSIQRAKTRNNKIPTKRNCFPFDRINSL